MSSHEETDPFKELAVAIRARRKALGVTQKALALLAGCGPDFIYGLEQGKHTLRLDKLLSVLAVLGLELVLRRRMHSLHQEDACQLLERYPADKYLLSCREIGEVLASVCTAPPVELIRYLELWAFSYVVGNGDLHGKNVSVLRVDGRTTLTPGYDLLTTLPYGDRRMALKLGARDDSLRRRDFIHVGEQLGVRSKATMAMLDGLANELSRWIDRIDEVGFDAKRTADLQRTMGKRLRDLEA